MFTWKILRHNVLCLNILWLKAVNEIITARQTRTSLHKHDIIKVCSIEYLTTQIESVLPTFKSWTVRRIIEYLTLGLLSSLWNIYHSTTAYFFDPPCICQQYQQHIINPLQRDATSPRRIIIMLIIIIIIIAMTMFMVLSSWPKSLREFTQFIWWM